MADFKPAILDAILLMDEKALKATFPSGACLHEKKGKPDRYSPADTKKEADKTLAWLVREKKRMDKPRFMAASGPQRLRWSSKQKKWVAKEFTLDEERGYTGNRTRALEPAEVVPDDAQKRYSDEARVKFEQSRTSIYQERLLAEKRKLKLELDAHQEQARERGISIRSDVRVIQKRLQEIDRKLGVPSSDSPSVAA